MTTADNLVICYNKGCGVKFNLEKIYEEDCCFHPGAPVFHDAYKGWSCCNKRSTDFTTFLNMKGCTKGRHNPEKPKEPEKRKPDSTTKDEIIVVNPPHREELIRPDINISVTRLKVTVSQSLTTALSKKSNDTNDNSNEDKEFVGTRIGEPCKNNGCRATYEGEDSNLDICKFHPGIPIFHEGLKYWFCCQRKTTDFDNFLLQEGCASGSHCWTTKTVKKSTCRYDWHQTPNDVYVTIYCKLPEPELSYVEVNPVKLRSHIIFGGHCEFDLDQELGGIISTEESGVTMAATKVEIKLKKDDSRMWTKLFLPSNENEKRDREREKNSPEPDSTLEPIDLSDI